MTGILDLLGVGILDRLGILLGVLLALLPWTGLGLGEGEGELFGGTFLWTGLTILGPRAGLLGTLLVALIFGLLNSMLRLICCCLGEELLELLGAGDMVERVLLGVILALGDEDSLTLPPKLARRVKGAV